ncbi:hypothetical protein GCM10023194_18840 [Planotetraspora phitsanulokensis]|uniref:Uncharacterized protein n=1 Tax=Planotetraspora phitsanulokensis TaxID=575192 RepID=A0A8J3XFZ0_9ACTN|nr:hypothetical protein [Planotetraspora phitsanulokensis]GII39484.1 hypothetical protein Pph01_44870 [Planotetraspora phitsanulokensis]
MPNVDLPALYAEFESRVFPESLTVWEHGDLTVTSNSAGHAIVLAESEEFWEDDDGSAAEAAWARLESLCREYEVAATAAWGDPHRADITHRLAQDESSPLAELLLEHGTVEVVCWDRGERAVGLSVGQMDKETAIQVVAYVVADWSGEGRR